MKKIFLSFVLLAVFCTGCTLDIGKSPGEKIVTKNITGFVDIASIVSPAIVGVAGDNYSGQSVGSGVCVSDNGLVLTNSHVINECKDITLYLYDKTTTGARVIYEDTILDFAILKADKNLPYLALGESDDLSVGEDILAVGTPLSLTLIHTFTKGIVSAMNRTLKVNGESGEGYMQNLIQHDASLNPGNSGGPLINTKGEIVGINTLKISGGEGIGFAIPTKSFSALLNQFVRKINYNVPKLGVYGFDNEIANFQGENELPNGFFVLDVADNSPLGEIGLMPNSVITKVNGRKIINTLDLKDELYSSEKDDYVDVEFYFDGEYYNSNVKL